MKGKGAKGDKAPKEKGKEKAKEKEKAPPRDLDKEMDMYWCVRRVGLGSCLFRASFIPSDPLSSSQVRGRQGREP